ncbi:MAG: hypothetical protein IBX69_03605 [Anaerolineales bacterium]|nr:hypothetical protein [Anaerolineales bacterium]
MTGNQRCAYCNRDKEEVPLIKLVYKDQESWICPQHLPVLIHEPQTMIDVMPGAENLSAGKHD